MNATGAPKYRRPTDRFGAIVSLQAAAMKAAPATRMGTKRRMSLPTWKEGENENCILASARASRHAAGIRAAPTMTIEMYRRSDVIMAWDGTDTTPPCGSLRRLPEIGELLS